MSAAKVKARKMWSPHDKSSIIYEVKSCADKVCFYVMPADADSVERMVEQMARALFACTYKNYLHFDPSLFNEAKEYERNFYKAQARAALAAIGVKAKGNK